MFIFHTRLENGVHADVDKDIGIETVYIISVYIVCS
jgi:hypothetical protein